MRMELTAALHHSASKSAGPVTHDALRSQKTVNSKEEAVFFEQYDEDTAGWRPAPLLEPLPQQGVARHFPASVDYTPLVQVLGVPVPQTGDEVDAVPHEYVPMEEVEQLVPQERVPQRTLGNVGAVLFSGPLDGLEQFVPQKRVQPRIGEHIHALGEFDLLQRVQQRNAEQVAHRFHVPHQHTQHQSEQVVDVHVPLALVSARNLEQVVGVPVSRADPFFAQVRPPTRAASTVLDAPLGHFDVFFVLFPGSKKC